MGTSPQYSPTAVILALIACAAVAGAIYAEHVIAGRDAAVIAAIGFCALLVLWSAEAGLGKQERGDAAAALARSEEELKKSRRLLIQQQATAKMLVQRDLELSHANDQLREIDQMKSEFVTVATHQLRTPLSAIRWTLQMILKGDLGPLSEEQHTFLAQAYESNNRLIALLQDILTADHIESGTVGRTGEHADAAAVIATLISDVRIIADRKGVSLHYEAPESPCPRLSIDPQRLRTVLQNLVENAVQYSREGGEVVIRLACRDKSAEISVTDAGIGIPRQLQQHIFSRFYRAENAVRAVTEGTGLGLYIAKRVVERAGGTITFTSEENVGTTFVVTLPVA